MAYKRIRVLMGYDKNNAPCYTQIGGRTQDERNDNIVKAYIRSGRIFEFMPVPAWMQMESLEPQKKRLFKDVAEEWYHEYLPKRVSRGRLRESVRKGAYYSNLKNHVLPYFGNWDISKIRIRDLQEFAFTLVNPKTEDYYKKGTIEQIFTVLKQVLDYASMQDYIRESPWKEGLIENPSDEESSRTPLSKSELMYVRERIPDLKTEQERLWMILFSHLPYRPSEAYAQRWEDISFTDRTCKVTGTVVVEKGIARYYEGRGKNKQSLRTMFATDAMMEALAPYRKNEGFVLCGEDGHFSRKEMEHIWKSIRKQIPLLEEKGITPYCFRHTYVTIMYHETKNMVLTSAQCGHITSKITEKVYTHDDMEYRRAAVDQFESNLTAQNTPFCAGKNRAIQGIAYLNVILWGLCICFAYRMENAAYLFKDNSYRRYKIHSEV